jgi:hypothetical protein
MSMLHTHEEIKVWLDDHNITTYTIRPDGIVDVDGNLILRNVAESSIPVQFGRVTGYFRCANTNLISLKGAPYSVVGGGVFCSQTKIKSLSGVDKIIKEMDGVFMCNAAVTHLLGLLLIKGVVHISIDNGGPIDKIFNKYVGTGDILSAQDELIDAGLIDQARL